jgi:acetyl/propionyl-CoA carboxylase alpha subunit
MKYHAMVRGEDRVVEVTKIESGYRVVIDGRALDVDAVHLQGASLSLLAGTRSARCDVQAGKDGKVAVFIGETVHELEVLDERRMRMRGTGGKFSAEGPQRIDSPMPGKVVRVLVKLGDEVTEGQGLIVVEAMKMENELKSPKAGKVTELLAVEGAAVESGAKLAVVA